MKKRIVLGSVVIALLMLVSTQIVFLNTVKSDPTIHTGDANAGLLWISELFVEPAVSSFDFVGIGHVDARDDWVLWEDGTGNITAEWTIITDGNHPEYFITFDMAVCNVDDDNNEIGNDSVTRTIIANQSSILGGTLKVELQFTPQQMQELSQTLVCYISTYVQIIGTTEAVNFSSRADDRSVIVVAFQNPMGPNFGIYVDEANDNYPSMWSWLPGWEEYYETEDEMLNMQTYFQAGADDFQSQTNGNDCWHLGTIYLRLSSGGKLRIDPNHPFVFYPDELIKYWEPYNPQGDKVKGPTQMNYAISNSGDATKRTWILMYYRIWHDNWYDDWSMNGAFRYWDKGDDPTNHFGKSIDAQDSRSPYGVIYIGGPVWIIGYGKACPIYTSLRLYSFRVYIVEKGDNSVGEEQSLSINWEEGCAYTNESYNIGTSSDTDGGITTVEANIYEILQSESENERIYAFAGDNGDVKVEFACEI